jgi:hypothetical protein
MIANSHQISIGKLRFYNFSRIVSAMIVNNKNIGAVGS